MKPCWCCGFIPQPGERHAYFDAGVRTCDVLQLRLLNISDAWLREQDAQAKAALARQGVRF